MCETVAQLNLNEAENNFVKCYIYKPNILCVFFSLEIMQVLKIFIDCIIWDTMVDRMCVRCRSHLSLQ